MTALLLDARDGNELALKRAYLEDEIDYFLDMEAPRSEITRDLFNLREAGRLVHQGDYAGAEARLKNVKGLEDEKNYIYGAIDAAQGRYPQAAERFRLLIDKRTELSKNLASLSIMGAARIFHEVKDYAQAVYHYNQIRPLDPQVFEAIFEKAWSLYLMGDMNGALGATLSFSSPFAEHAFYPEAYIVRAAAFFQLCYFERASKTIERLKRDYEPLRHQIDQLLARGAESWSFDQRTLKSINPRLLGSLLADRDFRSTLRAYEALKNEVSKLRGADAQLSNRALTFVKQRLAEETRQVFARDQKILRDILAQADLIQIDILQSGANLLLGQAPEHTIPVKTTDIGSVDFDELVQFWSFKGEHWLDELGSYYYGLQAQCASQ